LSENTDIGKPLWVDLAVPNAKQVKDFYTKAIGWKVTEQSMGNYDDFNMNSPIDGETLAGICHSKSMNQDLPPVWMVYFCVEDLNEKNEFIKKSNGKILKGPVEIGSMGRYIVIKDPAGAYCALWKC